VGFKEHIRQKLSVTHLSIRELQTGNTNKELNNKDWPLEQYRKILIKTHTLDLTPPFTITIFSTNVINKKEVGNHRYSAKYFTLQKKVKCPEEQT
jgi:hypothetical protein